MKILIIFLAMSLAGCMSFDKMVRKTFSTQDRSREAWELHEDKIKNPAKYRLDPASVQQQELENQMLMLQMSNTLSSMQQQEQMRIMQNNQYKMMNQQQQMQNKLNQMNNR